MHVWTILGLGLTANLDSLGIGLAYGMKGKRLTFASIGLITFITIVVSFLSLWLGTWMTSFMPSFIENFFGGIIIILIGLYTIFQDFKTRKKEGDKSITHPNVIDKDHNNVITWNESFLLGFILSLNNGAMGLGAGLTGINPYAATLSIGIFSFICLSLGAYYGHKLNKFSFSRYTEFISGILLIVIGLYECYL